MMGGKRRQPDGLECSSSAPSGDAAPPLAREHQVPRHREREAGVHCWMGHYNSVSAGRTPRLTRGATIPPTRDGAPPESQPQCDLSGKGDGSGHEAFRSRICAHHRFGHGSGRARERGPARRLPRQGHEQALPALARPDHVHARAGRRLRSRRPRLAAPRRRRSRGRQRVVPPQRARRFFPVPPEWELAPRARRCASRRSTCSPATSRRTGV